MRLTNRQISLIVSLLGVSLFIFFISRNQSSTWFSTTFYWEEGVDVSFRRNGTYRAANYDMLGGFDITCGKFRLQDSLIILNPQMKFGFEKMNDTLVATNKGIYFTMEKPWRVNEGKMSYVYGQTAKFSIENGTIHKIDSINVSFTKGKNKLRSIEPGKSIEYEFNMENTYIDGKYILSFRFLDEADEIRQIENITNGFPIETVTKILFHDNYITTETIFGNKITTRI
ncbi:MAG: hypothetical protein KDE33_23600 [Bacteroidetes bacterium]|nr:hypothetical protein [Bacteroidota bacterium]